MGCIKGSDGGDGRDAQSSARTLGCGMSAATLARLSPAAARNVATWGARDHNASPSTMIPMTTRATLLGRERRAVLAWRTPLLTPTLQTISYNHSTNRTLRKYRDSTCPAQWKMSVE